MRRCYLVCYDIRDDKRLRRVHKLMKAYGEAWQYSVFYCTLKAIDRVRLENALRETMNLKEDQVVIVDLGGNEEAARESAAVLGPSLPEAEGGVVVI
ncbi:MAG TPA: CRISPR-associated endonuclease Cas2 [Phycisphaerae bacterium]|nr:CRISPR-associated endonuclease Cas2 [Phycisphaerae bacterium]